jgi:hypothetical protein
VNNGVNTACPRHPHGGPTCWHNATDLERIRAHKAIMLSGGKHVPVDQLAPEWVKRYGIRP